MAIIYFKCLSRNHLFEQEMKIILLIYLLSENECLQMSILIDLKPFYNINFSKLTNKQIHISFCKQYVLLYYYAPWIYEVSNSEISFITPISRQFHNL
jgi:hypothetical protein